MWRVRVLTVVAAALLAQFTSATVFSEGGRVGASDALDADSLFQLELEDEMREREEALYAQRMVEEEAQMADESAFREQMANIIANLGSSDAEVGFQEADPEEAQEAHLQESPLSAAELEKPVEKPQKKGQSEYVSFVEPEVLALRQRDVQTLEKRRPAQTVSANNSYASRGDANMAMMVVGCVLVVGVVGGAVGGMAYRRRKENPDDAEYAPYAGTGPFKRSKRGEKQGDDTLAYKAQLHHYQQAKQKIICGDDAAAVGVESDDEECADDENNYSVYECPGLAPTGDIEVHNPNFAVQH